MSVRVAATPARPTFPTMRFGPPSTRHSRSHAIQRRIPARGSPMPIGSRKHGPISISITRGSLPVDAAIALGRETEAAALGVDPRISNSEGATVSRGESEFVYANTLGFSGGYRSSRHHIDCAVIGEADGAMQRDYWYTSARAPEDLLSAAEVGRIAGERTVRRLGARQLGTLECPVLFEAPEAARPARRVRARGVGRQPLSQIVVPARFAGHAGLRAARERPRRAASAARARQRAIRQRRRRDGGARRRRQRRAARRISSAAILRASSACNRRATPAARTISSCRAPDDLRALLRRMGRGLFVTEQLGQGVNPVTGDYSRGAAGFWVEDGAIAYPVEEITIAGNLKRDVPRRGRARHRRRPARLAAHRLDAHRAHDDRRQLILDALSRRS